MSLDYPDSVEHVERTPIQKLDYQIYGILSVEPLVCPPAQWTSYIWNIPDDGYYYLIDTIFFGMDHLYIFGASIDLALDQSAPVWSTLAYKTKEGCTELVVSRMGSFALKYPKAVRFRVYNYRATTVNLYLYCNYFKYIIEE